MGFQTKSVLIEGESLKIDQRHKKGNVVSSKGKYAGMLRFDLGLFQLLGDYFSLELTIPNQPSEKLSGFVMFKDAQGGSKYNLVCDAR